MLLKLATAYIRTLMVITIIYTLTLEVIFVSIRTYASDVFVSRGS